MNDGQKEQDFAACAHTQVERFRVEKGGKVFEEQWRCADCGTKFVTLDSLFSGQQKIGLLKSTVLFLELESGQPITEGKQEQVQ